MMVFNSEFADNLREIFKLQPQIKLQKNKCTSLLEVDQPLQVLKEIRLTIKYFKRKTNNDRRACFDSLSKSVCFKHYNKHEE